MLTVFMLAMIFASCKKDETTQTTDTETPVITPELDHYEVSSEAAELSGMTFNLPDNGM